MFFTASFYEATLTKIMANKRGFNSLTSALYARLHVYQRRHEWKDLWCPSAVPLLSTQIIMDEWEGPHYRPNLKYHVDLEQE
jgi:hypothetical protein